MERDLQEMKREMKRERREMKREREEMKREIPEMVKKGMEEMLKHLFQISSTQGAPADMNENPRLVREERVKRERQEMKRDMQDMVKRGMEEMLKLLPQISSTQGAPADLNENPRTPYSVLDHQNRKSEGVEFQTYELKFVKKLHNFIFTKDKIKDEDGGFVQIELINTSGRIKEGHLSSMEIEICVLPSDFGSKANEEWTEQEFKDKIVAPRFCTDGGGKLAERKLVKGKQNITLREGVGTMDDFSFLDNSSKRGGEKVRLGARVLQSTSNMGQVIRIKEAITEPFRVLDHRGKINHLKKIVQDDKILHKALIKDNIRTVSALRQIYKTNRDKLKGILGRCSDSEWAVIAQLACVVDDANSNPSPPSQVAEAYNPATTVLAGMQTNCNRASSSHRIISSGSEASSNNNGTQAHLSAEPHTPNNVMSSVDAQNKTTFPAVNPPEHYPISNNQNNNRTQAHLSAEQHAPNDVMSSVNSPDLPTFSDGNYSVDFSFLTDHPPDPDRGNAGMVDCVRVPANIAQGSDLATGWNSVTGEPPLFDTGVATYMKNEPGLN